MSRAIFVALAAVVACWSPATGAVARDLASSGAPFQGPVLVHDQGGQVTAPADIHPGTVNIANVSSHELVLVRRKDAGARRLVTDLRQGDGQFLAGRLADDFLVVDTVRPHAHVYPHLTPGTYLFADRHPRAATTKADVAVMRVSGSRKDGEIPASADEVTVTRQNTLRMHNPTYAQSALYMANRGTHTVQIRLYKLSTTVTEQQLRAFTSQPTWRRLAHLPVTKAFDLASLGVGRGVSDTKLPSAGRYVAIAAPLLHEQTQRPHLRRQLVASVRIRD
jgi:hypothetical protein